MWVVWIRSRFFDFSCADASRNRLYDFLESGLRIVIDRKQVLSCRWSLYHLFDIGHKVFYVDHWDPILAFTVIGEFGRFLQPRLFEIVSKHHFAIAVENTSA